MSVLILGLLLFLGVHSVAIVAPAARDRLVAQMGEGAWKGLYSLAAAVGLGLIVWGYGLARENPVLLYSLPGGMRHLAALLLLPVFVLLLAAYLPGRIQRATKHPMLLAVKLWALGHLLAQSVTGGSLADVLLFGGFLLWAAADRVSLKRRAQAGLLRPVPALPTSGANDLIAVVGGLALYGLTVMWAHAFLFGVRPFGGGI
ncbi:NnrU family protein [Hydrogenophaga pseudoflava]|uniref:NnrU family protein n=1 Tax=Hydrogenophaga pseudoflava TaxID=47421 RepID=UPI0027E3E2AA|nr:NnrU family protein [Hydrogenophaga pseudoflava]MDQ7746712.1 NnrU family protein [Hydrogenophaga pseudoflava]